VEYLLVRCGAVSFWCAADDSGQIRMRPIWLGRGRNGVNAGGVLPGWLTATPLRTLSRRHSPPAG